MDLLKTVPFDILDISVLTVEKAHARHGVQAVRDFMKSVGYAHHSSLKEFKPEIYYGCDDDVFVKQHLMKNKTKP